MENNNKLEEQDEFGIKENDLYRISFKTLDNKISYDLTDCKILNFSPRSFVVFKNKYGLFKIQYCNVKEILPMFNNSRRK